MHTSLSNTTKISGECGDQLEKANMSLADRATFDRMTYAPTGIMILPPGFQDPCMFTERFSTHLTRLTSYFECLRLRFPFYTSVIQPGKYSNLQRGERMDSWLNKTR